MAPGATVFTYTPYNPTLRAADRVKPILPAFAALQATRPFLSDPAAWGTAHADLVANLVTARDTSAS
jgi:hypothetical protein